MFSIYVIQNDYDCISIFCVLISHIHVIRIRRNIRIRNRQNTQYVETGLESALWENFFNYFHIFWRSNIDNDNDPNSLGQ